MLPFSPRTDEILPTAPCQPFRFIGVLLPLFFLRLTFSPTAEMNVYMQNIFPNYRMSPFRPLADEILTNSDPRPIPPSRREGNGRQYQGRDSRWTPISSQRRISAVWPPRNDWRWRASWPNEHLSGLPRLFFFLFSGLVTNIIYFPKLST